MVLKRPYAFFMKIFKPIHVLMAILLIYNMNIINNVLKFFNSYIYSNKNVVGQSLQTDYIPNSMFLIPIIIIIFSLIFMGIMFYKKKPCIFYIASIFSFLVVVVINLYVSNFLKIMEESIVSIKIVKLNHDLIVINMIIEIIFLILFIIRGLGINIKKFDFDSDISKFDVSEFDKEEFEFNINIDLDMAKRNRNKKIRQLKYLYKENKFIINIVSSCVIFFLLISLIVSFLNFDSKNEEGKFYSMSNFKLKVNKTYLLNENFRGVKYEGNYLVVVDVSLQTELKKISLSLSDFKLKVGEGIFSTSTKYSNDMLDFGVSYKENILVNEERKYIFIFEIPEKYIKSDFVFLYYDKGIKKEINLNANKYKGEENKITANLNETLELKNTLSNISFSINSVEIKDKFLLKYNYCISNNDCLISKEYLKPSIDENFDKCVLKLNVNYKNESNLDISNFYKLFSQFGYVEYKVGDTWYTQTNNFEEIKSKKVDIKENVYIGVNNKILNATKIKLIFNVRGSRHEYILR